MSRHIFLFSVHKDAMDAAVRAFAAEWPEARVSNLLDDSLFAWVREAGGVVPEMHGVFRNLTQHMIGRGAEGILFTCSAFRQVIGYTARNTVRVFLSDLTRVGAVVDTAVKAGGNQVQRVSFMLRDPAAAQNEALRRAVQVAREKAQTVAAALGLQITGFYNVVAHDMGGVRPMFQEAAGFARAAAAAPTPIEPGRIQVRSRVTLMVRVGN